MPFPLLAALGAAGGLSSLFGGMSASREAKRASRSQRALYDQQTAMLKYLQGLRQQYVPGALQAAWKRYEQPLYGDPYTNALYERLRGETERAYRPAYGQRLSQLSQGGRLYGAPGAAERAMTALDRSRGEAVSNIYMQRAASEEAKREQALQDFMNMLSQVTGGELGVAGAYGAPAAGYGDISRQYGALAQQGIGGLGDAIGQYLQLLAMQGGGAGGTTAADPLDSLLAQYPWILQEQSGVSPYLTMPFRPTPTWSVFPGS